MMPFNKINVGDIFQNPSHPDNLMWLVEEVDKDEKLIKITAHTSTGEVMNCSIWKSNRDRMFSESWRIW